MLNTEEKYTIILSNKKQMENGIKQAVEDYLKNKPIPEYWILRVNGKLDHFIIYYLKTRKFLLQF